MAHKCLFCSVKSLCPTCRHSLNPKHLSGYKKWMDELYNISGGAYSFSVTHLLLIKLGYGVFPVTRNATGMSTVTVSEPKVVTEFVVKH